MNLFTRKSGKKYTSNEYNIYLLWKWRSLSWNTTYSQWFHLIVNKKICISYISQVCDGSCRFRDHLKRVTLKIKVNVTERCIRNGAIRWQIDDFLCDCNSNVTVYEIFRKNQTKWRVFYCSTFLENCEGRNIDTPNLRQ